MSFIYNSWHMGAWATELQDAPVGRIVLDEPIVFFRTETGEVAAINDACPHRAVPLSLGTVSNGLIRCPYHALEFDGHGICRRNPHIKGPPDRIKTKSYPVVERHGMIWIWIGEAEAADPTLIVDYSLFDTPDSYVVNRGYLRIEADYRLVIDNLMDLAHAEYIHPDTVGTLGAAEKSQTHIVREGGAICVKALWPDCPPNAVNKRVWNRSDRIDQYTDMTWRAPANMSLDIAIVEPGHPRDSGYHTPSAHILTPASDRSTHYFWAFARNFEMDNDDLSAAITQVVATAFVTEDAPMIEAAQHMVDLTGQKLMNFTVGDAGSAEVRRAIDRLCAVHRA